MLAHEELYARAFVVSSFGKTYHVTGWKTGYVVAPPDLTDELRKVHQFVTFCGITPLQWALADCMSAPPRARRRAAGLLPEQARPVLRPAQGLALRLHPDARHLLPAGRLSGDPRRPERRGDGRMADPRAWRGEHSGLGVLPGAAPGPAPAALLLRQARGHPAPGRREAVPV